MPSKRRRAPTVASWSPQDGTPQPPPTSPARDRRRTSADDLLREATRSALDPAQMALQIAALVSAGEHAAAAQVVEFVMAESRRQAILESAGHGKLEVRDVARERGSKGGRATLATRGVTNTKLMAVQRMLQREPATLARGALKRIALACDCSEQYVGQIARKRRQPQEN